MLQKVVAQFEGKYSNRAHIDICNLGKKIRHTFVRYAFKST